MLNGFKRYGLCSTLQAHKEDYEGASRSPENRLAVQKITYAEIPTGARAYRNSIAGTEALLEQLQRQDSMETGQRDIKAPIEGAETDK